MRDLTGGDDDLKSLRPEHFRACADIEVFKFESPKNSEGVHIFQWNRKFLPWLR